MFVSLFHVFATIFFYVFNFKATGLLSQSYEKHKYRYSSTKVGTKNKNLSTYSNIKYLYFVIYQLSLPASVRAEEKEATLIE